MDHQLRPISFIGTTIGTAIGGWIGMWAGLSTWQRWHKIPALPSPPLPTIGELPDILVKKYKFHADVADTITENLIARYGHADTLEKFRKAPRYDTDADVLETLVKICK